MQKYTFDRSSAVQDAEFDPETGRLVIRFRKGGETVVSDCTIQEFRAFTESPSAGQFFNSHFKNRG